MSLGRGGTALFRLGRGVPVSRVVHAGHNYRTAAPPTLTCRQAVEAHKGACGGRVLFFRGVFRTSSSESKLKCGQPRQTTFSINNGASGPRQEA